MKKEEVLNLRNVSGYAESKDGKLIVLVSKKLSMNKINALIADEDSPWEEKDVIPKEVEVRVGLFSKKKVKTDVIEIGVVRALALPDRKTYDPIKGGCEIGPTKGNWVGTAGCVVTRENILGLPIGNFSDGVRNMLKKFGIEPKKKRYLWTNLHVHSGNVINPKTGINFMQSRLSSGRNIGKTADYVPMNLLMEKNKLIEAEFDDALIELNDDISVSAEINEIGIPTGFADAQDEDICEKYGRTTGYTSGRCILKNVTMSINYGENTGDIRFSGLDWFKMKSGPGDSGSIIIRKNDKKIVSHLFAGSEMGATFGIPALKVKSRLSFELFKN